MRFKYKNLISAIAVLMVLSFVVSIFTAAGITYAQTERERTTFPFVSVLPRNAGVGQLVLINFGLINPLATAADGWNVTAVITDPDGVVEKIPAMTWSTGTVGKGYTPTKEGDYKVVCTFDRAYYNATSATFRGWYAASESEPFILHVSADGGKSTHPGHGLPTEYWTRPIDSQLYEWYSISGSWVARKPNPFVPFNDAPMSAHVLWSMPVGDTIGGLAGGDSGYYYYQDGDAYEGKFANAIILSGILFYNKYPTIATSQAIVAVDLHTGEKLWERSYGLGNARISTGQILDFITINSRGVFSYIWITSGTNMFAIEPKTGDLMYNMTNVPSGTIYYGPNGELLKYQLVNYGTADAPDWHLRQWNSTWVISNGRADSSNDRWGTYVQGVTYNATERGYDLDVSIGAGTVLTGSILTVFPADRVIVANASSTGIILSAISLKPGDAGRVLFKNVSWQAPNAWQDISFGGTGGSAWAASSQKDYVAIYWTKEDRRHYCFSLETGAYMWVTDSQVYQDAWNGVNINRGSWNSAGQIIVYGKLYSANVGGVVYCYDVKSGERLWTYEATDKYTESYLAEEWALVPLFASCDKVYFGHMEHSTQEIKPRGAPFFALDAETGKVVWSIEGAFRQTMWGGLAIMGDSIIATMDTYDQQIYAIGKGPSSVTVTAPNVGVAAKSPVLIQGTVMDVSPGTQTDKMKLRFPNGVPAVSDDSMSSWMLYVYKTFERPTDTVGVPVTIGIMTPDGYDELYTVSDESGQFMVSYTPQVAGEYVVYAFFDGTDSYYGQWAQHGMVVAEAPAKSSNIAMYALFAVVIIMLAILLINLWLKKK